MDLAALAEAHVILFSRDRVRADEKAVVRLAVEVLEHFALAAAGRALVHEDDLVFIRRFDHRSARVAADPALLLADIQQERETALFGAGAGIEVVGKDLVHLPGAVVHDDLLAVKVRVAEGRGDKNDGAGLIVLGHVGNAHKALHIGKREGEERRVERADHQAGVAVAARTGGKGQQHDLLRGKPVERFLTKRRKLVAEAILEARLVGGQIVADGHGVGVAAAHIVLHKVDNAAVLAAHDLGLLHRAVALDGIDNVVAGGMRRAIGHLLQLRLRLGVGDALAFFQCRGDLACELKSFEILVKHHRDTSVFLFRPGGSAAKVSSCGGKIRRGTQISKRLDWILSHLNKLRNQFLMNFPEILFARRRGPSDRKKAALRSRKAPPVHIL